MAGKEPDDIERLLAEVDQSLSGRRTPARKGEASAARPAKDDDSSALTVAVVAGVIGAVMVLLLFAVLPFLGAYSGAAGAFLGAAGATLVVGWLHRRR
ncbi:MAG TPA: hypothetical protein VLC50_07335 [Actinomycetes bacterium]|nr:hypothetical protein [Actinomycetes bacterium]